ncbi:MAG TPA: TonB-dependent receptor [Bryobacteraceae bacterium]|nr:TonB-dependent receptor [Bryobacteraceae bacterium]
MRWLAVYILAVFPILAADIALDGRVVNDNDAPVEGALVRVRPANASAYSPISVRSDPSGKFKVTVPGPGDYLFDVERTGFYAVKDHAVHIEGSQELTLQINAVREVFQSENVNATTSPVDVDQPPTEERLSGTEVNDMPFANSHSLRSSMQLMPQVLSDTTGQLHFAGSQENQVLYLLNGFDITNPISGQFQTTLAVEGIRSLDLSSGLPSAEYGRGTAGVLNVNTQNGSDAFHYTATDFIPGVNIQQGLHLGNWYPRFGVSGPIVKGRAWFSDTLDSEYTETLVTGLPAGQNTRSGWAGSNLLHTQVNLTPKNILSGDFLVNVSNQGRVGLAPLDPVSTTSNVHSTFYVGSVQDQVYFGHGLLVNFGYAHQDYELTQTPQGDSLFLFSPEGNTGNYYVNASQTAVRDQGLVHAYLPKFSLAGTHQLEAGGDADGLHYHANDRNTGYEVLGLNGELLSGTRFGPPALFRVRDVELASYLIDTWRVSKNLQFVLGIRDDHDQKIHASAWSPRLAGSWSPLKNGHTKVSGGYAITHDAVTMNLLGRPLDQTALTTTYLSGGVPAGPPAATVFSIPNTSLLLPRAGNWNAGVDQQISPHFFVTANYLRRRGTDGFVFVNPLAPDAPPSLLPVPGGAAGGDYQLTNLRRDDYDSISVSVHQTFSGQFEWMLSYTHSRAVSNVLVDPNTPQPLAMLSSFVPLPWNVPDRVLGWAYVPLPWKNWAVSTLADMRSGYPFSVRDQGGAVIGQVDSYRYPLNFDLNIAIERMVTFHGYRFALRVGVDNLTGQANPTAVNNVFGAPQYLQFLGDEGRHFVIRVRFFGRAGSRT